MSDKGRHLTEPEKAIMLSYGLPQVDIDHAVIHEGMPWFMSLNPAQNDGITLENDVYLAPHAFHPDPASKDHSLYLQTLAHELIHVGQYRHGMTRMKYLQELCKHGRMNRYEGPAFVKETQVASYQEHHAAVDKIKNEIIHHAAIPAEGERFGKAYEQLVLNEITATSSSLVRAATIFAALQKMGFDAAHLSLSIGDMEKRHVDFEKQQIDRYARKHHLSEKERQRLQKEAPLELHHNHPANDLDAVCDLYAAEKANGMETFYILGLEPLRNRKADWAQIVRFMRDIDTDTKQELLNISAMVKKEHLGGFVTFDGDKIEYQPPASPTRAVSKTEPTRRQP